MTEDEFRSILRAELATLRAELRAELAAVRAEIATVRIRTDGLPLLGSAIDALQRDVRLVRAAINDMGRTNITAGEVEALHADVDRALALHTESGARIATLERLIEELRSGH
jgi:hypothetical protein